MASDQRKGNYHLMFYENNIEDTNAMMIFFLVYTVHIMDLLINRVAN